MAIKVFTHVKTAAHLRLKGDCVEKVSFKDLHMETHPYFSFFHSI
jgi:hypothetical protein